MVEEGYSRIKDLPKAIWELLRNATYMFISWGAVMDGFLLAGTGGLRPTYIVISS